MSKKLTFSEFKIWLQGVEEMQDAGWYPSQVQWEKIKEKLEQVSLDERPVQVVQQAPTYRERAPVAQPAFSINDTNIDVPEEPARTPPPEFFQTPSQTELDRRAQPKPLGNGYATPFK